MSVFFTSGKIYVQVRTFLRVEMEAMQFRTTDWTSLCDLNNRIKAFATTITSDLGAKWW
jgi:hypothetical protein